jgi:hypothetical protein
MAEEPAEGDSRSSLRAEDEISKKVRESYERVPHIGETWIRWYDLPYRFVSWLLSSWRRRVLPYPARRTLNRALNFLMSFNHYDRLKVARLDDPMENLIVPQHEELQQGGVWVVELFPPSKYKLLIDSLQSNGWDRERAFHQSRESNMATLDRARQGSGLAWWRLGTVATPNSRYMAFDAKREALPPEYDLVELTAVQIGESLTAVVAFFRFSDDGSLSLNRVWHQRHEPRFVWRGLTRRPWIEGRLFAGIFTTLAERQRLHDVARRWLTVRCPGFFADQPEGQPVIDFSVLKDHDPLKDPVKRSLQDPLRALGFDETHFQIYEAPQMPGCALIPSRRWREDMPLQNCWGILGKYDEIDRLNDASGYGDKPLSVSTCAARFDDEVRAFALYVAITKYAEDFGAIYSHARDRASTHHGRFRPARLDELRRELMVNGLDLRAVARDSALMWRPAWQRWSEVSVQARQSPSAARYREADPRDSYDLIKEFARANRRRFKGLLAAEQTYRDVLVTAASLGSAAESSRLARSALLIAVASFVATGVSILVVDVGRHTLAAELWNLLSR